MPDETDTDPDGAAAAETAARENLDAAIEMQMSFLASATSFAEELSGFARRQAQIASEGMIAIGTAPDGVEGLRRQFETVRALFKNYAEETERLLELGQEQAAEAVEAVRSSHAERGR